MSEAEAIGKGFFCLFHHAKYRLGFPPDWHFNPFTEQRAHAEVHWSRITDTETGDIKGIWELNRFGCIYPLVRAYWRTGKEEYAERFWRLVEDWREKNLPNQGANWKCGQETSLRTLAWCFGLYAFAEATATTPARVAGLVQMLAFSGERIEKTLNYALSQRNNHGISEGAGLWTLGILFPEFRHAERWEVKGRKILEALGRELIAEDGTFVQNSMNYHRLMLHLYLWVLRLGDLHLNPFSAELKERVKRAGEFLSMLMDENTGQVPLYGPNDGAWIFPLAAGGGEDYRPVAQAIHFYSHGEKRFGPGPWDEETLWWFGPSALKAPSPVEVKRKESAPQGGYYCLRSGKGFAFVRCAAHRTRPGHADQLHVDLWWRGHNVAMDAGTYSYNSPPPWDYALAHTSYHNTVSVDGLDQMERASRFLWLPWAQGSMRAWKRSEAGGIAYWEGEHDGYRRLFDPVIHRRGVLQLGEAHWLICDDLWGREAHEFRLHWLLIDRPYRFEENMGTIRLNLEEGEYLLQTYAAGDSRRCTLVRGDGESPRGWQAFQYYGRRPALSFELITRGTQGRFYSLLGPAPVEWNITKEIIAIRTQEWEGEIILAEPAGSEASTLILEVERKGPAAERLQMG